MKTFIELRESLQEEKFVVKNKKDSVDFVITQKGGKFVLSQDGQEVDKFKSKADAQQGARDLVALLSGR